MYLIWITSWNADSMTLLIYRCRTFHFLDTYYYCLLYITNISLSNRPSSNFNIDIIGNPYWCILRTMIIFKTYSKFIRKLVAPYKHSKIVPHLKCCGILWSVQVRLTFNILRIKQTKMWCKLLYKHQSLHPLPHLFHWNILIRTSQTYL